MPKTLAAYIPEIRDGTFTIIEPMFALWVKINMDWPAGGGLRSAIRSGGSRILRP
jgi:hypothetical protein